MREPRNTQNTRKNGEVESGGVNFNAESQRRRDEWFGDVPSDWDIGKMRSVVSERREKFNRDEKLIILSLLKDVGIIPYSEKGDVGNKSKEDHSQYKVARKGDLVINSMNVIIGSVGISPYDGYISPAYYSFVPRENVCMGFIGYLCSTRRFQKAVRCYAKGIMEIRLRVSSYDFLSMPIPLPPLSEQKAIVKYLDAETGRIDKAIAAEEKMIALLQERREIVINEAVSGSGSEGIDFNAEAQRRRGWEVKKLKAILKCFGRIGFRGYGTNDIVDENEGAITLSPSNINEWQMDFSKCTYLSWQKYKESPEIIVEMNDIIFVKTGAGFGKCALVKSLPMECTINPQLVVFKKIKENTKYLMYLLQTEEAKRQVNFSVIGGTIPTIAQSKIGNYAFLFPPLSEQEEIVKYLDAETGKIDRAIEVKRRQIELLRERRQIVIDEAVTGKVRVA